MPKIQVADANLHYVERGTGEVVVLVHGGLVDYRLWGRLSKVLSQRFRVISYSRRGAFPSDALRKNSSSVPLHSADLSSLISQLSDRPVHLVGESYGAYVAIHCALHNPDKVSSLAVDEPPILSLLSVDESGRAEIAYFENHVLRPALDHYAGERPEDAGRVVIDFLEGSAGVYDSLPEDVKEIIAVNSEGTFEDLKGGFGGIEPGELGQLRVRTLLMKSEMGPRLLKRVVDGLYERIPNRNLLEVKGTTHGTILDSPEYSERVLEFLSQT